MAIDTHGDIYVADWLNDRVQMFNSEGRYVDQFIGDANLSKSGRQYILANTVVLRLREMTDLESTRRLSAPNCVRVDSDFRLFICDVGQHRIQVYKVEKWKAGDRYPANSISVLMAMDRLAEITLVPGRRRRSISGGRNPTQGTTSVREATSAGSDLRAL